ncbi:MAG TPA: TonB-dependent receptor plug domain-containing protein [Opitutaceae bacterium]|jgi:iron complex outermembrane receptor protein|nr:TonB-dependent receptor plug domain-containing protein [Opitutaceae bacterium]
MNYRHPSGRRCLFGATIAFALATGLLAQTTSPESGPSANNEEVLTLPEFGVSAKTGETYVPTEDAAGSRIKTPLKQLPYAVTTLNAEFFQDFGIFDLTDEMNFIPSLQGSDLSGGQTLRGFTGNNTQLRNGFAALGTRTRNGLEKVTVIKGPAAMIYGQTSPGGTVFLDTVRPSTHPYQKAEFTVGSYGTNQTNLAVSGPLWLGSKPKLFYRIDVEDYERRFQDPVNRNLTREWLLTLMYKPSENTDILFDGGYQVTEQNNAQGLPYLVNGAKFIGWAYQLKDHYYSTPTDYRVRQRNTAEVIFEHRFNDWLSFRAGANVYKYPNTTLSAGYSSSYDPAVRSNFAPGQNVIGRANNETWSEFTGFGESYTGEFLANYHTGPVRHTTLITFDYYNNIRRNEIGAKSNTTAQGGAYDTFVSVLNPRLYPALPVNTQFFTYSTFALSTKPLPTMVNGHTGSSGSYAKLNVSVPASGVDFAHEAFFFDDKLLLTAAYRHDYYRVYAKDDYWGLTSKVHGNNDAIEAGISYAITKEMNIYADETQGFLPPSTSTALYTDATKTTSLGYEAGMKGAFLDNKLNLTADIYKTVQRNIPETTIDIFGNTFTQNIGGVNSQGFEGDATWQVSDRAYVYAAYAYLDSRVVSLGTADAKLDGWGRQSGTPRHSFASVFRYELLTGLSAMVRMRYNSDAPVNTQNSQSAVTSGQALVYSPAFAVWDLGLQYKFKTTKYTPLRHSISLWAKNVFNKTYIIPGGDRYVGDPIGFYLTYTLEH